MVSTTHPVQNDYIRFIDISVVKIPEIVKVTVHYFKLSYFIL